MHQSEGPNLKVISPPDVFTHPVSKELKVSQSNILGLIVLALGGFLLFFAWRASNTPVDQVSEALTGRFTSNTMWYLVGGLIGTIGGLALLLRGRTRA